ncbi:MAG: hypothetical protein JO103_00115 [Candidatus Eremiobacteraeota bacterium]|nr:hypothetical protein [Candidatus Eremiobacteraeota bacterium]MBV9408595.1 hypothetical protein [Candidatus Eremiobacteraeota bacterium]
MTRWIRALISAAGMCAVLAGCGRQVTGLNIPGGGGVTPSGTTMIRFDVAGPLDFTNVRYLIVFNTKGNNVQPTAQGNNTDFTNWSAFFIIGGGSGFVSAPGLEQIYQNPANGANATYNITIPQGTLTNFQTQLSGALSQYGFQFTFNRCLLDLPPPSATPPPPLSVNRICPPFQNTVATTWNVSLFTIDNTNSPIDSLSVTGPGNGDYTFQIDTTQSLIDKSYTKPRTNTTVSNPGAQIVGIEVFSTP